MSDIEIDLVAALQARLSGEIEVEYRHVGWIAEYTLLCAALRRCIAAEALVEFLRGNGVLRLEMYEREYMRRVAAEALLALYRELAAAWQEFAVSHATYSEIAKSGDHLDAASRRRGRFGERECLTNRRRKK